MASDRIGLDDELRTRLDYLPGRMLRVVNTQLAGNELILIANEFGIETLRFNEESLGYHNRVAYGFTDKNGSLEILSETRVSLPTESRGSK